MACIRVVVDNSDGSMSAEGRALASALLRDVQEKWTDECHLEYRPPQVAAGIAATERV